jgi:hypothetical protein
MLRVGWSVHSDVAKSNFLKEVKRKKAKSCSKSAIKPVVLKGLRVKETIMILIDVTQSNFHVPM